MPGLEYIAPVYFLFDLVLRLGLSVRVIMRRLPASVSLAWLAVILAFPMVGAVAYLILGEYRLGRRREQQAALRAAWQDWFAELRAGTLADERDLGPECAALARVGQARLGSPALAGNRLQLLPNAEATFPALIADIDRARRTCHFEFYIWSPGGTADEVVRALIRAAGRGVKCRVLLDAIGSAAFLRSDLTKDLRAAKVEVVEALPVGFVRTFFARPDLRLHRKIVVIDGEVGYTGSLNLADPRYFKREAGVGPWVDAFVRVEGPAVAALGVTFLSDWAFETDQSTDMLRAEGDVRSLPPAGAAAVQVLSSGPAVRVDSIEQIVLTAVYGAKRRLTLTTPYFIPSDALMAALITAASRGVEVTLIVPARVDSKLVDLASRAYEEDLLKAGVKVALYEGGLLHTKSITADDHLCLFGSLNLDPRSMRLDFEITLAVYDAAFTEAVRQLQWSYQKRSTMRDLDQFRKRSVFRRFAENAARLAGPVL